jgi:hypothetical protein
MKITYVGPFDAVEVPVGGRFVTVKNGEPIDLPVALAGRPPAERLSEILDVELPAVFDNHEARSALIAELATVDAGEGLLAQPSNWQPVAPAKKETTP